jgi:hypothetical protein
MYAVEYTDRDFVYVSSIVGYFEEAVASNKDDPSLLCPCQDEDVIEEHWNKHLTPMCKISISQHYIVITNTATFCYTVNSHGTSRPFQMLPVRIRTNILLGQFKPPLLLTSDDFNQPSVTVAGTSDSGAVPSVTNSGVSRTTHRKNNKMICWVMVQSRQLV